MPILGPRISIPTYPTGDGASCITRRTRTRAGARFPKPGHEAQLRKTTNDRTDTDTSLLDDRHRLPDDPVGAQQERARGSPPPPHLPVLRARDPRPRLRQSLVPRFAFAHARGARPSGARLVGGLRNAASALRG